MKGLEDELELLRQLGGVRARLAAEVEELAEDEAGSAEPEAQPDPVKLMPVSTKSRRRPRSR